MAIKDKDVRRGYSISGQVCSCLDGLDGLHSLHSLTARNPSLYRNFRAAARAWLFCAPASSDRLLIRRSTLGSPRGPDRHPQHHPLTEEHVKKFAEISGDYNPLHFNETFAAETKFGRLVVQGGLTTGLLHALVAMDMPGPGTVFLSQNWKFTAPVFIGDTITAEAEVTSVHASKPVTGLAVKVSRANGETVLDGEAWCYTFEPQAR